MIIKTHCPKSFVEEMSSSPILGSSIATPAGARLFEETQQVFRKIGKRALDVKSIELRDLGLCGNDYVSEWHISFGGLTPHHNPLFLREFLERAEEHFTGVVV